MDKERQIDIQSLKKYPEFWALKQELENFCDRMDNIDDIELSDKSRLTLAEEIYGRRYASIKVRDLISTLGLVDKKTIKRDLTME